MAAQFVFFYLVSLLMAVRHPNGAFCLALLYSSLVLRSIWKSWKQ